LGCPHNLHENPSSQFTNLLPFLEEPPFSRRRGGTTVHIVGKGEGKGVRCSVHGDGGGDDRMRWRVGMWGGCLALGTVWRTAHTTLISHCYLNHSPLSFAPFCFLPSLPQAFVTSLWRKLGALVNTTPFAFLALTPNNPFLFTQQQQSSI